MPVYRVSALQNIEGQRIMNVYYYETNVALGGSDAVEIADAIVDAYVDNNLDDDMVNEWAFAGIELRRVDIADQPALEVAPTGGSHAGLSTAEMLPLQVALLVSGTALTVFPRRVRTYLGGFSETNTGNGLWGAPVQGRALDFIEQIHTITGTAFSANRVAVSFPTDPPSPVVNDWNEIEAYSTSAVPATQRRRRIGVGI